VDIFPKGRNEESQDDVTINLCLLKSSKAAVRVKYSFSILNERGEEMMTIGPDTSRFQTGYGHFKYIRRDILLDESNGMLLDDKLTIFCEVGNTAIGTLTG
jgi:speckle-type POZ protein